MELLTVSSECSRGYVLTRMDESIKMIKLRARFSKAESDLVLRGHRLVESIVCAGCILLCSNSAAFAIEDPDGRYYTADSFIIKGEKRACKPTEFNAALNAVKRNPRSAQALYTLAKLYIIQHDYEKATGCLNQCMALDAQSPRYLIQRACIELALENDEAVKKDIIAALAKKRINPWEFLSILQVLQAVEERDLAYDVSKRAMQEYGNVPILVYESGLVARVVLKYKEAEALFIACRKEPTLLIRSDIQLTEMKYEKKNWPDVVKYSDSFATRHTDINKFRLPDLLRKRSEALYWLGRYPEALKPISEAITISPMQVDLRIFRARLYRKMSNPAAAKADMVAVDQISRGY